MGCRPSTETSEANMVRYLWEGADHAAMINITFSNDTLTRNFILHSRGFSTCREEDFCSVCTLIQVNVAEQNTEMSWRPLLTLSPSARRVADPALLDILDGNTERTCLLQHRWSLRRDQIN
jgi:hypothetical protein